jgi:hypothetical protein
MKLICVHGSRVTRWVCGIIAHSEAQPIFVKMNTKHERWIKVAQNFMLTSVFLWKLPKENNRPKGQNSPNAWTAQFRFFQFRFLK